MRASGGTWRRGLPPGSAIVVALLITAGCSGGSAGDAARDYRFATFEITELVFGPVARSVTPGVDALPGADEYELGRTPEADPGDEFGAFVVLNDPTSDYVIRTAASLVADLGGAGTLVRGGLAFDDGHRVVAQWINSDDELRTVVMRPSSSLPMTDWQLGPALSALSAFLDDAETVQYVLSYERLWEDSTVENQSTGVVTTGDSGEHFTATVSSDLTTSGSFATSSWVMTTDGVSNGALAHVEWRWSPAGRFVRAGCEDEELRSSGWLGYEWDPDGFANLISPGYVPALVERLVEPELLGRDGDVVTLGFGLRRHGLLGQPWPLWAYGLEWDVRVAIEIAANGEPTRLRITSSRGPSAASGPASDSVDIEFTEWNGPVDVVTPNHVVDEAPWPPSCRVDG